MPKMKTNSSAKKRFKLTGSGKIKRNSAYKRHLLACKSKRQKRDMAGGALIHKSDEGRVKAMLNIGK